MIILLVITILLHMESWANCVCRCFICTSNVNRKINWLSHSTGETTGEYVDTEPFRSSTNTVSKKLCGMAGVYQLIGLSCAIPPNVWQDPSVAPSLKRCFARSSESQSTLNLIHVQMRWVHQLFGRHRLHAHSLAIVIQPEGSVPPWDYLFASISSKRSLSGFERRKIS